MLQCPSGVDEDAAAHRFAGAFLVPASAAYIELGRKEAVSQSSAKRLSMWLAPYNAEEPGPQVPFEEPRRLLRPAMRARAEGIVSSERADELYGGRLPDPDAMSAHAAEACC